MFEINYDLEEINWKSWHNWFHSVASLAFVLYFYWLSGNETLSFFGGWSVGVLWEVGDGFKPWWFTFQPSGSEINDWLRKNLLYSNKFSLEDVFVWDLGGCLLAIGVIEIGKIIFMG